MKKLLAILLALTFVLSLGAISFAADEVTGTLADGTAVTKPVSEVVKDKDSALAELQNSNADLYSALAAFFESAAAGKTVLASGVVNFGGAFNDVTEATIEVPVAIDSAKAGDRFFVALSNGSARTVRCEEDGVVPVAVPKDAENLGFVVAAALDAVAPAKAPAPAPAAGWVWTPVLDEDGNEIGMDGVGPNGETVTERWDDTSYSYEYNDPNTGEKYTENEEYDEDGNLVSREYESTGTDDNGKPYEYSGSYKKADDGTVTNTSHSKGSNDQGEDFDYSRTSTTDPDGNTTTEETVSFTDSETGEPISSFETTTKPDGTSKEVSTVPGRDPETETHYYDADKNEIFPSPQW